MAVMENKKTRSAGFFMVFFLGGGGIILQLYPF